MWNNVLDVKYGAIIAKTHFLKIPPVPLALVIFVFFYIFSPVYAVVKQTLVVLVFHTNTNYLLGNLR